MQKSFRRKLFYLAVTIFIFLSIGVLAMAFGVTYDFTNNQLIKTGSLDLQANVDAQIFLEGKLIGGTSLLGNSFSKRNLLPGLYRLGVKQDGFNSWQKEVEIKVGLVTDFARVLLVAEKPLEEMVRSSLSAVFFSEHDRWAAYLRDSQLTILDLYSQESVYQTGLTGLNLKKIKVLWDPRSLKSLVHDGESALVLDVDAKKTLIIKNLPPGFLNEQTVFDGSKIYNLRVQKKQNFLESFDISTGRLDLVAEDLDSFYLFGSKLFFISNFDRRPYLLHLAEGRLESFAMMPLAFSGPISKVEDANDQLYFLIGNQLFATNIVATLLLADGVKKFAISPDRYLLGWITDNEVWTVGLKENLYQPQRKVGESERLITLSNILQNLAWHKDSGHLFLDTKQAAILMETDIRGGINQYPIFKEDNLHWRYSADLDKILQFKDGRLILWSYD